MLILKWEDISNSLDEMLYKIFLNNNIDELSNFEKRKLIFDYIVNNIDYDYKLLDIIKHNTKVRNNKTKNFIPRYIIEEIPKLIKNKIGVCNAISQVYKLLLEKVGIYSMCIICDDTTNIPHQLVLVKSDDSYSFDDPTSIIVKRGTTKEFFNYDLQSAKENKQKNFIGLPSEYVYCIVGRIEEGEEEKTDDGFLKLPTNIKRFNSQINKKI